MISFCKSLDAAERGLPQPESLDKVKTMRCTRKPGNSASSAKPFSAISAFVLWFNTYRKLFAAVITANFFLCLMGWTGVFHSVCTHTAQIANVNILVALLVRQTVLLRLIYAAARWAFGPMWVPQMLKHSCVSVLLHLGGVHSGCAVAGVIWLAYATIQLAGRAHAQVPLLIAGMAFSLLAAFVVICATAYPALRSRYHDTFEHFHRIGGWIAMFLLWVLVLASDSYDPSTGLYTLRIFQLLADLDFWCAAVGLFFLTLPWVAFVRKVPVTATVRSGSLISLQFRDGCEAGLLSSIARSPLRDWHTFGIASPGPASGWHMMVIVGLGDFTQSLIQDPPTHLYTRTLKAPGFTYLIPMYRKVVVIATGTGIGVVLSYLLQLATTELDIFLVWIGKDLQNTFGTEIYNMVNCWPACKLSIVDTARLDERVDVPSLAILSCHQRKAEAIFAISNPRTTRAIVAAGHAHGIAAFGPIQDV